MQIRKLMKHQENAVSIAATASLGKFIFPTGTGKSLIESHILIDSIKKNPGFSVYMITLPRILLAQQIYDDIWTEVVVNAGLTAMMFNLHCGGKRQQSDIIRKHLEDAVELEVVDRRAIAEFEKLHKLDTSLSFDSGTSIASLKKQIIAAKNRNIPLIICSTYHSGDKVALALEDLQLEILICDEAHNTVSKEFSYVHELPAKKRFYFTATEKWTEGDLSMTNKEKFGETLASLSPAQAIHEKLIVRPRIHFITGTAKFNEGEEHKADAEAVKIGFKKHAQMTGGIGAKIIVSARGTNEIQKLVDYTDYFKTLRSAYPFLKVFSIYSGVDACRINGVSVSRQEFMDQMKAMKSHEQAIIIHYDILSEGIDVPGITGIMPLRNLGLSKFLQTLGRSTRLYSGDRERRDELQTDGSGWNEFWVKPYAWVIIPEYGILGNEICGSVEQHLAKLRSEWNWIPHEDIYISQAGGEEEPVDLESLYKADKPIPKIVEDMLELSQKIEEQEKAEVVRQEIMSQTFEQLVAFI